MVMLRGVFWLSLVAAIVPYSKFDSPNATFAIDHEALMRRVAELPHVCRDNPALCEKAQALAGIIADESVILAQAVIAQVKAYKPAS